MHGLEFIQTRIKALRQDPLFEEALRALEKNGGPIERATVELLRELADGNICTNCLSPMLTVTISGRTLSICSKCEGGGGKR
jgi:hypothetical protein